MYKRTLALVVSLCFTSSAFATFTTGEVKRIYPVNDKVHFRLKEDSCITGSQYYYFKMNEVDNNGKYASKNWYSMLLASAIAGKPVSVKVNSCPEEGNVEVKYLYQDY